MAKMSKFDKMASRLSREEGVSDPRGLAAYIGRRKYGTKVMAKAAARHMSAAAMKKRMG